MWPSSVRRLLWEQEIVSSNLTIPTTDLAEKLTQPANGRWNTMDGHPDAVVAALTPPEPGRAVRILSPLLSGVAHTRDQIAEFHTYWSDHALTALADPRPGALVVLGDSLAQGIGASDPQLGYPHQVATAIGANQIVNLSRSGAKIADVCDVQLPALGATELVDPIVICTVGSNDLLGLPARPGRLIGPLLEALPPSATIATIPDIASLTAKRFNRQLRTRAASTGHRVADLSRHLPSWSGRQAKDRFHPNDIGYECWTAAFVAARTAQPTILTNP